MGDVVTLDRRKPSRRRQPGDGPDPTLLPLQFDYFTSERDEDLAKQVGIWDVVPYTVTFSGSFDKGENLLATAERSFETRGRTYTLKITPARIVRDGKACEVYPNEREEHVEYAVRKIASRNQRFMLNGGTVAVTIPLYELYEELRATKHTYNYPQIIEALEILKKTHLEISRIGGVDSDGDVYDVVLQSTIFKEVQLVKNRNGAKEHATQYKIEVNSLIAEAIKCLDFHDVNYAILMSLPMIERWVYKYLQQEIFASTLSDPSTFILRATQIQELCGMGVWAQPRDAFRKIGKALEKMVAQGIFETVREEPVMEPTGRTLKKVDVVYTVRVSAKIMEQSQRSRAAAQGRLQDFETRTGGAKPKDGWRRRKPGETAGGSIPQQASFELVRNA